YIALGVVVLLTLGLLKLPTRAAANLKLAIGGMFLPLFGLAGSTEDVVTRSSYAALPRGELVRQLELLQKERQEARPRTMQAGEALRENDRLRQQFGIARQYPWHPKLARPSARAPANWWRSINIHRRSRHRAR